MLNSMQNGYKKIIEKGEFINNKVYREIICSQIRGTYDKFPDFFRMGI